MSKVSVIFWKELTDYFGSRKFMVLFLIIVFTSLSVGYTASQNIEFDNTLSDYLFLNLFSSSGGTLPSLIFFISFFGPLMGIILGFDAISEERSRGTISLLISQPIFRDAIINGKFWAGIATIAITIASIIVIMAGLSMYTLGIVPNAKEIARISVFFFASLIYIGFWLSLGILFSTSTKRSSNSALISILIWIFITFFVYMIAGVIADQIVPIGQGATQEIIEKNQEIKTMIMRVSPAVLFEEISIAILNPSIRLFGYTSEANIKDLIPKPLPLSQSLTVVWPQFIGLIALTIICFAVTYIIFMRQEIRST
ncbi:MAG TPA: ABC transporter [Candidatus Atribacteria bacterium]|nr:ABC transporter [Candidatus Atribacteria bacterium]